MKILKNIILCVLIGYFVKVSFGQYVKIKNNKFQIKKYDEEINNLNIENTILRNKLESLENADVKEQIMREKYNLVRDNEHIFKDLRSVE